MNYNKTVDNYRARCDYALKQVIATYFQPESAVSQAAEYSLLNGGKRVRGTLVMAVCDMLDGNRETADTFAAAIEMMHAFSLVHDDLPCMDDDDYRRGKPATHIQFDEATALLAGDTLAIQCNEVIAGCTGATAEQRLRAIAALNNAAGATGMIYGQELDLEAEETPINKAQLELLQSKKTGALINAAAELGAIAADETKANDAIKLFAANIGRTFQIVDDILDVTSTAEVLGKPIGSDEESGKTTYTTVYGVDKSKQIVVDLTEQATAALTEKYNDKAKFLVEFAKQLAKRVY